MKAVGCSRACGTAEQRRLLRFRRVSLLKVLGKTLFKLNFLCFVVALVLQLLLLLAAQRVFYALCGCVVSLFSQLAATATVNVHYNVNKKNEIKALNTH